MLLGVKTFFLYSSLFGIRSHSCHQDCKGMGSTGRYTPKGLYWTSMYPNAAGPTTCSASGVCRRGCAGRPSTDTRSPNLRSSVCTGWPPATVPLPERGPCKDHSFFSWSTHHIDCTEHHGVKVSRCILIAGACRSCSADPSCHAVRTGHHQSLHLLMYHPRPVTMIACAHPPSPGSR